MKILTLIAVSMLCFSAQAKDVKLDTSASKIQWVGSKKIPGDNHTGTIKITSGKVNLDKKMQISGGNFTIDMNSINSTDLKGKWKEKLDGHLKSDDFFASTKNPTAEFKITKITAAGKNKFKITGNLTIRKKTSSETFMATVKKMGNVLTAKGKMSFDRNKYGVTYNSEASVLQKITSIPKDKVIKDQINIDLDLKTMAL